MARTVAQAGDAAELVDVDDGELPAVLDLRVAAAASRAELPMPAHQMSKGEAVIPTVHVLSRLSLILTDAVCDVYRRVSRSR